MKRAHNDFHASKLKPATQPDINQGSFKTINKRGNKEDAVRAILNKGKEDKKLCSLVPFYGDIEDETVWTHKLELGSCKELQSLIREN